MSKTHKSYRLDSELLEAVDSYAEGRGMKPSEAVSRLLSLGLSATQDGGAEAAGGEGAEDLRRALDALTGQLEAKDEQIREQRDLFRAQLEAKDEQIRGLMALTNNAQALQASEAARLSAGSAVEAEEALTVEEQSGGDSEHMGEWSAQEPQDGSRYARSGREAVDSGQTAQGGSHGALAQEEAKRDAQDARSGEEAAREGQTAQDGSRDALSHEEAAKDARSAQGGERPASWLSRLSAWLSGR